MENARDSDACALACAANVNCQAATWSEISGTEFECHTITNWDGSLDKTAALVMTIEKPTTATAQDNYDWHCPARSPQKFIPPNLAVTYHCDQAISDGTVWDIHTALDPDACILACKARLIPVIIVREAFGRLTQRTQAARSSREAVATLLHLVLVSSA